MKNKTNNLAKVMHFSLQGKRSDKYDFLNDSSLNTIQWNELEPDAPNYFLVKKDFKDIEVYEQGFSINEIFTLNNAGVETGRDEFFIDWDKLLLKNKLELIFEHKHDTTIINQYKITNTDNFKFKDNFIKTNYNVDFITKIGYRPFDLRACYYAKNLLRRSGYQTFKHFSHNNIALIVSRSVYGSYEWYDIQVTKYIVEKGIMAMRVGNAAIVCPLYLYPDKSDQQTIMTTPNPSSGGELRIPNLNMEIVKNIADGLGLEFTPEKFPSVGGVPVGRGGSIPEFNYNQSSAESGGSYAEFQANESSAESGGSYADAQDNQSSAESGGQDHATISKSKTRNTMNYMSLPYNPKLKERAKELRKAGNLSEVLFWNQVKNKGFKGLDFDRQKIIGNYIVDFYCAELNLVIEIDGSSHDEKFEYDSIRDAFLEGLGLTVIHFSDIDIKNNLSGVIEMLESHEVVCRNVDGKNHSEENDRYGVNNHPALKDTPPMEGNLEGNLEVELIQTFAPIDILDYIYAILHSPTYREKYKEFLKIDFPRVPYPKDKDTFWELIALGSELRQIHLLESPVVDSYITSYPQSGSNEVVKPTFKNSHPLEGCPQGGVVGIVYINDNQYFENVPEVAWNFYIGGYQPAQKWLKDRKGRTLNFEDIMHYQKIIVALTETDRIMKEIEKIEVE